jgi:hypothetical protein
MRVSRKRRDLIATFIGCSAALLIAFLPARRAAAQPDIVRSASILLAPRIVTDDDRDTMIEIANVSFSMVSARCLYLDGSTGLEVSFDLMLARQNSARWTASEGLLCPDGSVECNFAPGLIPPLPVPFSGALVCIEVDASGATLSGNHFILSTTILDLFSGDAAAAGAIGLSGTDNNNGDNVLGLGDSGAEYAGCPDEWILNHVTEGAEDPLAGTGSSVSTTLTFVNCGQDFERATVTDVPLEFTITNEMEQTFMAETTVSSWAESSLETIDAIFRVENLGSTYAQTRIRATEGGVAIVAHEVRRGPAQSEASAAFPLTHNGSSTNPHAIVLPQSLLAP